MLGNAMNAQVLQRLLECVLGLPPAEPPRCGAGYVSALVGSESSLTDEEEADSD
jgi:hypothetical protein